MKRWIKYSLYGAIFLITLGVSAFLTTRFIVKSEPEVTVPDLTGHDTISALKVLSGLGLHLKVQGFNYSDKVPKDKIMDQDPKPGMRVKRDRDIRVIISKDSRLVKLPKLQGLSLDQARSILEQSELSVGLISYVYGSTPEEEMDRILAQVPEAMTSVAREDKVDLLVSLGPRPVELIMPDLTAQNYSVALLTLERIGLKLGPLQHERRPNWPVGAILIQDPAPGSRVDQGAMITLTVNRGGDGGVAEYKFHLLDYQIPHGFLRREIRFHVEVGDFQFDIHEDWHGPGEVVQTLALVPGTLEACVYEDDDKMTLYEK
ncbi:MAG: PASTA domain-containing protein [Deltaproteobacteria bacterium]|nr:PASTA domain-containing protein [Deltaproteobacteria bacterium]MBW2053648.1 PASTA domain-containing protein [Deltaproteobacteria bacterium]MBW2142226.1 PASTA domain-containing protein [Deltaproteobacteria bacterium]MBW2324044.1 PASTA domain-containing protein [Deltaproteobacteria bacterium]